VARGTIQDVSEDGVCIQLDREFATDLGAAVFTLTAPDVPELPREAKLRCSGAPLASTAGSLFLGFSAASSSNSHLAKLAMRGMTGLLPRATRPALRGTDFSNHSPTEASPEAVLTRRTFFRRPRRSPTAYKPG
jgi:hypothetical protein